MHGVDGGWCRMLVQQPLGVWPELSLHLSYLVLYRWCLLYALTR